jgi:catechol O-methyltransferase
LKPVGVDDANRADMTLLPFSGNNIPKSSQPEEAARAHIERLPISKNSPWLLQEFVEGKEFWWMERSKHSLHAHLQELLMHYEALPPPSESKLTAAMLKFTERICQVMQQKSNKERSGGFTGHLSFDFLMKDEDLEGDNDPTLYPIECNPRAHTATVLFKDSPVVAKAYLEVLKHDSEPQILNGNGHTSSHQGQSTNEPFYPSAPAQYYWLPHDLVILLLLPVLTALGGLDASDLGTNVQALVRHLLFWRDGSFTVDDPLPALWQYHVYWPAQFVKSLWTGKRWSRINVSTTKMFGLE